MRKRDLIGGIISCIIGTVCLAALLLTDTKLETMFVWGTGYCLALGIAKISKYRWWNLPENRNRRDAMLESESIDHQDELQVKIRDRAGRGAYIFGQYIICAVALVFIILSAWDIHVSTNIILFILCGYLLLQLIAEKMIHHFISKKY